MTASDTTATVPDEAVRLVAEVLEHHQVEWIPETGHGGYFECGCNEHGTTGPLDHHGTVLDHQAHAVLAALAHEGWVLVPGPVETEWATQYRDDEIRVRSGEAGARSIAAADPKAAVKVRQATAWRPAPATPDGAAQ